MDRVQSVQGERQLSQHLVTCLQVEATGSVSFFRHLKKESMLGRKGAFPRRLLWPRVGCAVSTSGIEQRRAEPGSSDQRSGTI